MAPQISGKHAFSLFSPMTNGIIHYAVPAFSSYFNNSLLQLAHKAK